MLAAIVLHEEPGDGVLVRGDCWVERHEPPSVDNGPSGERDQLVRVGIIDVMQDAERQHECAIS